MLIGCRLPVYPRLKRTMQGSECARKPWAASDRAAQVGHLVQMAAKNRQLTARKPPPFQHREAQTLTSHFSLANIVKARYRSSTNATGAFIRGVELDYGEI
jgi:hypothetical protein